LPLLWAAFLFLENPAKAGSFNHLPDTQASALSEQFTAWKKTVGYQAAINFVIDLHHSITFNYIKSRI